MEMLKSAHEKTGIVVTSKTQPKMPSSSDRVQDPSGGANQTRVRAHNERLVLTLVRRHGNLAKSEIARRTGLSAQTVSVIMRALEADGLLLRGEPVRGKVGQPSIPMALNPDGVYSFGLKVGRRSAELVLMDFIGTRRKQLRITYPYPMPDELMKFALDGIAELSDLLSKKKQERIAGIGIAIPFQLWEWEDKVGAPKGVMDVWKNLNFEAELEKQSGLTTFTQNDATAACGAELTFGRGAEFADFVYFFVGAFIGGGIVLNHSVYSGRTGNAGAMGAMPVLRGGDKPGQLLNHTSLYSLEQLLVKEGRDPHFLRQANKDWSELGATLDDWLDNAAFHLAMAILSACSLIDFEAAIIDGSFPDDVRAALVDKIKQAMQKMDLEGIDVPHILEGSIGSEARALGGASLPLFNRYLLDQTVLFKEVR